MYSADNVTSLNHVYMGSSILMLGRAMHMMSNELVVHETRSMMKQLLACTLYSQIIGSQIQTFTERWWNAM